MVSPIFDKLSDSLTNLDFYKVDVDEQEVSLCRSPTSTLVAKARADAWLPLAAARSKSLKKLASRPCPLSSLSRRATKSAKSSALTPTSSRYVVLRVVVTNLIRVDGS